MAIDLNKIKSLKEDSRERWKRTKNVPDLVINLNEAIKKKEDVLLDLRVFDSCSWIEWNELWISDKNNSSRNTNSYPRRKLVKVQLGYTHVGSEASYSHPAVILYEEKDWVLIAPITSKKFGKGLDLLIDIPLGTCTGLDKDSTIQLDHIRAISKKRIIGTLSGSLPVQFMDKINLILMEKYAPHLYRDYQELVKKNMDVISENNKLKEEKQKLEGLLRNNMRELEEYKKDIEHIRELLIENVKN